MNWIIGILRLFLFLIIVLFFIIPLPFILLCIQKDDRDKFKLIYRGLMARTLFPVLGIDIVQSGAVPIGPSLLVSNHRSYIDPAPVAAITPVLPLAKMEIGRWPLIGLVVKSTGILLVDRSDPNSRRAMITAMKRAWRSGKIILNYPEGTTHDQDKTIRFHSGAFAAAKSVNIPVIAMAIDYGKRSDAWIGSDTFLPHFIRCFGKWRTQIYVSYGDPHYIDDVTDHITKTQAWIDAQLEHFRSPNNQNNYV